MVLLVRQPNGTTLRLTEAELDDLLKSMLPSMLTNQLARMGGRVD